MRDEGPQDPLDDLIDSMARSMTDGAPPASLRAVVRERIERIAPGGVGRSGRAPGRPFVRRLAWAGGAVAAIVLLIVGLARDEAPVPSRDDAPPAAAVARPPDPEPPNRSRNAAEAFPETVPEPPQRVAGGAGFPPAPDPAREPGDAAPAPGDGPVVIELVNIEPLVPEALPLELMEVPIPLRVEVVQIDPISIE